MNTHSFGILVTFGALLSCVGCASLQSVSVTNIPTERARPIQTTANNPAFLGIHFDNDFADGVPDELRRQCPNGKVTGVYAKYETTWYVLVENRAVTVKAYCVPRETPPTAAVVPVPPAAPPPTASLAKPSASDRSSALTKQHDSAVETKSNGGSS